MNAPRSFGVTAELDQITIRLPRRLRSRRLLVAVWGLAGVLIGVLSGLAGQGLVGVALGGLCGLLVAMMAEPIAARMGIRIHGALNDSRDGCAMAGGVIFLIACGGWLANVTATSIGAPEAVFFLFWVIALAVAVMIPLGTWITQTTGTITLTPTALRIDQRAWALEEIERVDTRLSGKLCIDGEVVLDLLNRYERVWLRQQLRDAVATRQRALTAAGHDLSEPARPPESLQALRDPR